MYERQEIGSGGGADQCPAGSEGDAADGETCSFVSHMITNRDSAVSITLSANSSFLLIRLTASELPK